jgi:hypothetical protein
MIMNIKRIVLLTLLSFPLFLNAQDRIPVQLNDVQINLNLLAPGVALEKMLTENTSATFGIGLTPLYEDTGDENSIEPEVSINPFLRASYRNYYPRKKVKKELNPNSGNYIGLVTGYYFDTIAESSDVATFRQSDSFYLGAMWGIQRNYKSGIHLGFSIGGGFGTGQNMDLDYVGVGEFELGFVIK